MKESFVPRNIVATFNAGIAKQFIDWSRKIHEAVPSHVVLNTTNTLPHLTLYSTNFPTHNLTRVLENLETIANEISAFDLKLNNKSIVLGTLFIDAMITEQLQHLHIQLVDALNPFREGFYDENELTLPNFTEDMKYCLIHYGMWAAKHLYMPHVTVARPIDPAACEKAFHVLPEDLDISTRIESISIVERGPNGTCKKILHTFPLRV